MAAGTTPIFVKSAYTAHARVNAANTNHDGSGTLVDIVTGQADGTRVERVSYALEVTSTAGCIRFWHYNGTDSRLVRELAVPANTVSASNPGVQGEWSRSDGQPVITLKSGDKLQFTMEKAEAAIATAICGDY